MRYANNTNAQIEYLVNSVDILVKENKTLKEQEVIYIQR